MRTRPSISSGRMWLAICRWRSGRGSGPNCRRRRRSRWSSGTEVSARPTFWGISFAPSDLDRLPMDPPVFERNVKLLRAAWAEFDAVAKRVSPDLRPGVRGGGRSRDQIVRHVLGNEGGDFSRRVKAQAELDDLLTPTGLAAHRDRFVEAMRDWYAEGKPLGNWTIPYLLRHTAYHVLDHTWEMEDRDLTEAGGTHVVQ
jgi:hypothetical protein